MDWSAIGPLVAQAAPTIGGILGGFIPVPGGAVLGQVAGKVLAEALGVPPTPDAVKTAIEQGDPDVIKAQLANADAAMSAEVEKFKAQLADVADARSTTVELVKAGSPIAWGPVVMSVLIVTGFLGSLYGLMFVKINFTDLAGQAYLILVGILSQAFAQVTSYWLGSSAGSAQKTDQLAALAAGVVPAVKPLTSKPAKH